MSSRQLAYVQKRRSTRIYNAIPLAIQGSDAFRAPYQEQVSTLTINCHGCRYLSKYEVIQGDTVYLELEQANDGSTTHSCQAQVKWVQRQMTKDSRFEIAVELAAPGNIWGIVSPPKDWFPVQVPKASGQESSRREQPVARRIEKQETPALNEGSSRLSHIMTKDPAEALSLSLSQLMSGFGNQIQIMVSHAATAAFVKEREHLMEQFRTQLQNEATRTLESVVSRSKEDLTRRMLEDPNDAHELAARINYERWNKKIEQDTKIASQCLETQAVEISRRVKAMASSTFELLQRNMEATRPAAVGRFVSALREQFAPLLEDAQVTLQNLTASKSKLKDEFQTIRKRFEACLQQATQNSIVEVQIKTLGILDQFESDIANRLAESHESLTDKSIEVIAETTKILRGISQGNDENVEGQLRSLISSAADDVTKVLNEQSAQTSRQFSDQLDGSTRSYLDSTSDSITQCPKRTPIPSVD